MTEKSEYHIASFIALVDITQIESIKKNIESTPGAEIHVTDKTGKVVFTIEANNQKSIGKYADELKYQPGILTLSPVYHQYIDE